MADLHCNCAVISFRQIAARGGKQKTPRQLAANRAARLATPRELARNTRVPDAFLCSVNVLRRHVSSPSYPSRSLSGEIFSFRWFSLASRENFRENGFTSFQFLRANFHGSSRRDAILTVLRQLYGFLIYRGSRYGINPMCTHVQHPLAATPKRALHGERNDTRNESELLVHLPSSSRGI